MTTPEKTSIALVQDGTLAQAILHLQTENERLRSALINAQSAIQRVAGINDETRLGWALKDIEQALKP